MNLYLSSAPHVHTRQSTQVLMRNVIIALLPCAVMGVINFGYSALITLAVSVASAILAEFLWQKITHKRISINDLSAAVTGLILGLNLPPSSPWWMAMAGSFFAIIIVKQLFGGLGDNFMNPALAARAILLASWPTHMTTWVSVSGWNSVDAISAATPLAAPSRYTLMQLFMGNIPGSIGEVCKVAILAGFAFLLLTGTVTWHIPVIMTASTFVFSYLFGSNPVEAILSGGLLFGAVFMATDYVTNPMTLRGKAIFAAGAGLMVAVIRVFGNYPEGVTYAILLMNIATPLIDKYIKNRVYGHRKEGAKTNG